MMVKKRVKKTISKTKISRGRFSKEVPVYVKIISILYYFSAVISFIIGIGLFIGGVVGGPVISRLGIDNILESGINNNPLDAWLIPIFLGSLIIAGLLMIGVGVLFIYIGKGLWRGRNWARITTIVFSAIGLLSSLGGLDFVSVVINGLIGGYLLFSKQVKKSFS